MMLLRRILFCLIMAPCLFSCIEIASAQQGAKNPAPSNAVVIGRSFYVEGAVVVLLIGGAIYAVCRPSRRV